RTSLYSNVILSSKLLLMYSHHNKLIPHSLSVFLHMPHRNIYSWNIIIGEFSRSSFSKSSLQLFVTMLRESHFRPDDFTLPLVLRACACSTGDARIGGSLHGLCVKSGLEVNLFVASALVFMYVNFGKIFNARKLFDRIPKRDSVLWTTMLAGYAQQGEPLLGFQVFKDMVEFGVELDWVVMVSLLLLCAQMGWLKHGRTIHGWCIRKYLNLGLNLGNAIIDMYIKCGTLNHAHNLFDKMPERDIISWSSLISGYGLSGNVNLALSLFNTMLENRVKPNGVTFLGVLSACAHGGLVEKARGYFKMMEKYGVVAELKHCAAMVDCLARAGMVEEAERFVREMEIEPDEAVLCAILNGCFVHGNVEVGERIIENWIKVN
ncbi:pentatricopeptide repeat-containing protein At4g14170, partial [Carica papaya]|uniref:pentatricopeptide repeat-containing protein At4g14170 n=1 Tax=Carica papaya TaxID=3649 RepID=UPI000B8CAC22